MFLFYNLLISILAPIWGVWVWLRARRRHEKPIWKERLGEYSFKADKTRRRIWVHAVSVGEVVAAKPILKELRKELPDYEIVLSVTTSSGHQTAREGEEGLYDHLVYFPIDVLRFQVGAMQRVQPAVVAIMETELWFNFLWAARTFESRTMLINGRISDRSFRRSQWVAFFYQTLLPYVDRCLMQDEVSRQRILALGAKSAEVVGSSKFDQASETSSSREEQRAKYGYGVDDFVVVVGSTRGPEEEALVIQALADLPVKVLHAPRHLETVEALAESVSQRIGEVALHSQAEWGPYLILDTYGELADAYLAGDVAIVGGGFANFGGQNLIQAFAAGVPVVHGPNMQNFREAAEAGQKVGASIVASNADELRRAVLRLKEDEDLRSKMGQAGQRLVSENLGASRRYAQAIAEEARRFQEIRSR